MHVVLGVSCCCSTSRPIMANNKKRKGARSTSAATTDVAPARKQRSLKQKPKQLDLTAGQLYEQAQIALQNDDFGVARERLRRATAVEPCNAEIAGAYGALLAELGLPEAVKPLRRAIELAPQEGFDKYMYLAQITEDGSEAERLTRQGVEILRKSVVAAASAATAAAAATDEDTVQAATAECHYLRTRLSSALCSLAEHQLHLAPDPVPDALADAVAALLEEAQVVDPGSPEPGQALASLRYEQGRPDEALAALRQSLSLWFQPEDDEGGGEDEAFGRRDDDPNSIAEPMDTDTARASMRGSGGVAQAVSSEQVGTTGPGCSSGDSKQNNSDVAMVEDDELDGAGDSGSDNTESDEEDELPSLEFRCECAKLLIELDDTNRNAVQVLEGLVQEDDSNPDVWQLLGLAYYSGHQFIEAKEAADAAALLITKLKIAPDAEVALATDDLLSAIMEAQGLKPGHPAT